MSDLPGTLDVHMLSDRIRIARKEAMLSQIELAQLIGVSDKAISSYEVGRAIPPLDILKKISVITEKQMSFFFDEDPGTRVVLQKVDNMIEELNSIKKIFK
jgi:transcriptional regulator with XRE-family HTH domain